MRGLLTVGSAGIDFAASLTRLIFTWMGAAARTLGMLLRSLLGWSMASLFTAMFLSWYFTSPIPLLIDGILAGAILGLVVFKEGTVHAILLLIFGDLAKATIMGRLAFNWRGRDKAFIEYKGTNIVDELSFLRFVTKTVFWIVLWHMLIALVLAAIPIWAYPSVGLFIVLGLMLWGALNTHYGLEGAIPASAAGVLVAIGIMVTVLPNNPWYRYLAGEAKYMSSARQIKNERNTNMREARVRQLKYAQNQILTLENARLAQRGKLSPGQLEDYQNWLNEEEQLLFLIDNPEANPLRYIPSTSSNVSPTAARVLPPPAGTVYTTTRPVGSGFPAWLDRMGEAFRGLWTFPKSPNIYDTGDATISGLSIFFWIIGVLLLIAALVTIFRIIAGKKEGSIAGAAALLFLALFVMVLAASASGVHNQWYDGTRVEAAEPLRPSRAPAPAPPPTRRGYPSSSNRGKSGELLYSGFISKSQFSRDYMTPTGFVVDRDIEITITRFNIRNPNYEASKYGQGFSQPQRMPGMTDELVCANLRHMSVLFKVGSDSEDVYSVGEYGMVRLKYTKPGELYFWLNQFADQRAWEQLEGDGFYYEIRAA
jgi:hypothetical protein